MTDKKPAKAPSEPKLSDSDRIDRLEAALQTGLNIDLGAFDTPDNQAAREEYDAAAAQAEADAQAEAAAKATADAEAEAEKEEK